MSIKNLESVTETLVRIIRRLTLDEVQKQIHDLEMAYGMSFDDFEEKMLTSRKTDNESVETYFKWAGLVDAYRGYVEGGELHGVIEELHDLSLDELEALTPKRLELLRALANLNVQSINDLAHKVRRDVKNVYQDLQVLKKLGLVKLDRKRERKVVPEVLIEEITLIIQ